MPQRTASRCDAGWRSVPALFAMCRVRCAYGAVAARNRVELRLGERRVGVRRRRSGSSGRRRREPGRGELREPPAPHARVELEVDRDALGDVGRPRRTARAAPRAPRRPPPAPSGRGRRSARAGSARAQLERLAERRDAERRRAGLERRPPDVDRAVPVAVGLDDRPQLGAVEQRRSSARTLWRIAARSIVTSERGIASIVAHAHTSTVMPSQAKRMFLPSSCSRCSTRSRSS